MENLIRGESLVHDPEADGKLYVRFYSNAIDGKDHVELRYPGDKLEQPDFLVEEDHKLRWPQQWEAYSNETDQLDGQTRIEDAPWIDSALYPEFRHLNIHTVEHLAAVSDAHVNKLGPGGLAMREKAQAHVERDKKASGFDDQQARIASLEKKLAELTEAKPKGKAAA